MKLFFTSSLIFMTVLLSAQIVVSERVIDYGEIGPDTSLEKEIFLVNTGSKSSLLLTNDFPRDYSAHINSKNVAPGDTVYLRWKFNPFSEGVFNDKVTIWFSTMNEPLEIEIKGNVKYIDPYSNPSCPNFNERPAGQEKIFITDFVVQEEGSKKRIKGAQIRLIDRGVVAADLSTDRNGERSAMLPIRYFYFLVEAEGYESADLYSYVNAKNHRFIFDLAPLIILEPEVVMVEEKEIAVLIEDVEDTTEEEPLEKETHEVAEEIKNPVETIPEEPLIDFDSRAYRPNNIVFLVDVSGSMNQNGRMDILKASMIDLVGMMRPEDKISLVSYARNTSVLLEPTSGANKEEIIAEIRALSPQGATNGERGLKQAYSTAKSSFISKGNNRVYIATDGVFRVSEVEAIEKLVTKNSRRSINLSVLGIKGTSFTKKKMAELAKLGKGDFLDMEDFDKSAEGLKQLVKSQSKKR
ncbi:MAG: VWA domain-containing protein [Flavobacteriales bacterium]|jgi:Ca-activated chloride channel family protein